MFILFLSGRSQCRAIEGIVPLYGPYKKRQYDGQTKTPDSFRLLLVELLHGGKVFKNDDYRKKSRSFKRSLSRLISWRGGTNKLSKRATRDKKRQLEGRARHRREER
jgi:hypothetical protein